ncbi:AAA family ATPase [Micromonospora sp. WMMD1102]|uniref:SMI1/KNR4 family protein n=1 Tax=Micromonospora sp. WMMD1102 TaxID=3016105 RepID=UPI00241526EF|nr:AAA family ATPase [Micromonospora sp. WMMD1102]MDG4784811.1 AAA family ATPase [Micromonospora sp. WMMD1102]
MTWPDGGPWVVATTSSSTSWAVATAAICAASTARVAVLRIVDDAPDVPPAVLCDNVASYLEVRAGAADPTRVTDLARLVRSLSHGHGLVLVAGAPGLVVPVGRAGWTLAELARTLGAPVVLVADLGPEAVNHTTLALDVLAGRDLAGTVVAVGEGDGDELAVLPVRLAGRIPADAADRLAALPTETFRTAAPGWLDPLLHATRRPTATRAPEPPAPASPDTGSSQPAGPQPAGASSAGASGGLSSGGPSTGGDAGRPAGSRTVSGKRVLIVLLAVFLASVLLLCGLNLVTSTGPAFVDQHTVIDQRDVPDRVAPTARLPIPVPPSTVSRPSASAFGSACPPYVRKVVPTVPDRATTARIDGAWSRIERWLARHAPRSLAGLRPPAAPARIAALQVRMSVPFPADLVASLRRHDGAEHFDLPPFYRPLSLDEIGADRALTCDVRADMATDDHWWHPAFVPFASAGDGGSLLVDQRSGGHGRVGEFYPEDGTGFDGWPASVTELLVGVARSLETGEPYAARYRPTVDAEGRLAWTIE